MPNQIYEIKFKIAIYEWGWSTLHGAEEGKRYHSTHFDPELKSISAYGRDLEWQFKVQPLTDFKILEESPPGTSEFAGENNKAFLKNHEEREFLFGRGWRINTYYYDPPRVYQEGSEYWSKMEIIDISPSPFPQPQPQPRQNPTTTDEDEMNCCRENLDRQRMMFRELNQTITVDAVDVVKLPTGDMSAIARVEVVQVFGLPGTVSGWKRFYSHLADTKKKAVDAVNQARKSRLMARVVKTMQVANFLLDIHTAAMLSRDLAESFFGIVFSTIDNAAKVIDDLPFIGNLFDIDDNFSSQSALGSALDEMAKKAFGVENWTELKAKWAALNRITASANTLLMSVRDLQDTATTMGSLSCEISSKFANKARKDGVLADEGRWFPENYSKQSAFRQKIYNFEESAQGILDAANFFEELSGTLVQGQENYKQFKESRDAFEKTLTDEAPKIREDNKPVKDQATQNKANSQGATVSESDINPQGDTN